MSGEQVKSESEEVVASILDSLLEVVVTYNVLIPISSTIAKLKKLHPEVHESAFEDIERENVKHVSILRELQIIDTFEHDLDSHRISTRSYRCHVRDGYTIYSGKPNREVDLDCPIESHFRNAEAVVLRMTGAGKGRGFMRYRYMNQEISRIDYVENKALEAKFNAKKAEFKSLGINSRELTFFHGTQEQNVESIFRNNFDLSKTRRTLHGYGIYFSEFPDLSLGYGQGLLLCRVLPGRVQKMSDGAMLNRDRFDSLQTDSIDPSGDSNSISSAGSIHVIAHPDQVLPYCRIYFRNDRQCSRDANPYLSLSSASQMGAPSASTSPMGQLSAWGSSMGAPSASASSNGIPSASGSATGQLSAWGSSMGLPPTSASAPPTGSPSMGRTSASPLNVNFALATSLMFDLPPKSAPGPSPTATKEPKVKCINCKIRDAVKDQPACDKCRLYFANGLLKVESDTKDVVTTASTSSKEPKRPRNSDCRNLCPSCQTRLALKDHIVCADCQDISTAVFEGILNPSDIICVNEDFSCYFLSNDQLSDCDACKVLKMNDCGIFTDINDSFDFELIALTSKAKKYKKH